MIFISTNYHSTLSICLKVDREERPDKRHENLLLPNLKSREESPRNQMQSPGANRKHLESALQFSSVQSFSRVRLFATPWIAARQASLSITNSRISLRLTSIESVMPSSYLIICCPLLLLPPIPPSIKVFSNQSTLRMRWPKYWSFSFSIIPSKEIPGLISLKMDWLDLLAVQGTLKSLLQPALFILVYRKTESSSWMP